MGKIVHRSTNSSSIVRGEKAENMGTSECRAIPKGRAVGSSAANSQLNRWQGHQVREDCSWGFEEIQHSRLRTFGAFFPLLFHTWFSIYCGIYAKDMEKPSIIHYLRHYLAGSSWTIPFLDLLQSFPNQCLAFTLGFPMVHPEKQPVRLFKNMWDDILLLLKASAASLHSQNVSPNLSMNLQGLTWF